MNGTVIAPGDWRPGVAAEVEQGRTWLDLLTAVDRGDGIELVLKIGDPTSGASVVLTTRLDGDAPSVDSLVGLLPAAAWQEREIAEMFGVEFVGHPEPRPLLLRHIPDQPPLRRATPLPVRLDQMWPGAAGATERRRSRAATPPGVRTEWVEETRQ